MSVTEDRFLLLAELSKRRVETKQIELIDRLEIGRRKMNRIVKELIEIGVPIQRRYREGFCWILLSDKDVSRWKWNVHV